MFTLLKEMKICLVGNIVAGAISSAATDVKTSIYGVKG